jgi:hypothetical protein
MMPFFSLPSLIIIIIIIIIISRILLRQYYGSNRRTIITTSAHPTTKTVINKQWLSITTELERPKHLLLLQNYPGMIPRIIIKRLGAELA